jgi:hypothetical protein
MKKTVRKLRLCRESIRRLSGEALGEAHGGRPTLGGTCNQATCIDSCATCPVTCATCGGGTACGP